MWDDLEGVGAGDVDDRTTTLLQHGRQHGARTGPGRLEVESQAASPCFFRHVERLVEDIRPGIVDENIDAAGFGQRSLDQARDLRRGRHVGLDENGPATGSNDGVGDSLPGLRIQLADEHSGAVRGEQAGNRLADALASTGDDGALTLKPATHGAHQSTTVPSDITAPRGMQYVRLERVRVDDGFVDLDAQAWFLRLVPAPGSTLDRPVHHLAVPRDGAGHFLLNDDVVSRYPEMQRCNAGDRPQRIVGCQVLPLRSRPSPRSSSIPKTRRYGRCRAGLC